MRDSHGKTLAQELHPRTDWNQVLALQEQTRREWTCSAEEPSLSGLVDISQEIRRAGKGWDFGCRSSSIGLPSFSAGASPSSAFWIKLPGKLALFGCPGAGRAARPGRPVKPGSGPGRQCAGHRQRRIAQYPQKIRGRPLPPAEPFELHDQIADHPKVLQENLVTQRNGRYCLPVKSECRAQVPGVVHDQSASGAALFIEPLSVVEGSNEIAGLGARKRRK